VLIRVLGAGGSGEVWLARDRESDQLVAVKILKHVSIESLAAFEAINARVAALDDPHLLCVQSQQVAENQIWLAMDYAPGGDLRALRGRSCTEVLKAAIPIAAALGRIHRLGIVHRDVKPSNVLLMADGSPRVSDFGAALLVTQMPGQHVAPGSLYNMSPECLDGAPAAVADDVYAFGAMLYELLSGYPPFYPNITPERIRSEDPPRINARISLPDALHELIAWCLRKAATERPASMEVVEAQLRLIADALPVSGRLNESFPATTQESRPRGLLLEQSMSTNEPINEPRARSEAPVVRPPAMPAEPLRGEWRRAAPAPDPSEFHKQGFRRGLTLSAVGFAALAIFIVFFALPKWVNNEQPAPQQAASTPVEKPAAETPRKEPVDFAALARAKQQAEEVREPLNERLEKLRERGVEQWAADDHKKATEELAAGDAQFAEREYVIAVQHFERLEPILSSLESRASVVLKEQLAAGAQAITEGRSEDAKAAFDLALKLDPKNAVATRGAQRAGTLDQVLALLASADRAEKEGNSTAAMADFRKALDLDQDTTRASEGLARVSSRVAGDAFASAMARGFADLGADNYAAARSAFESAGKIRSGSPEVASALKQVEQSERTRTIAGKLEAARAAETREQWAEALQSYRDALSLDSTVAAASEGVARVQPRTELNEQLEIYLTQPERLFSSPVRVAARETLQRAESVANSGPVLKQQVTKLRDWLARADVPVQVALQSDNLTQVTVYRIGQLGSFEQRSLELAPGEYTVLGTRPGYRDVRRQIMVVPGTPLPPVVIRCEDKI
jgi:eukaryotic-like serine/threonine-protein kinase